MGIPEDVCLSQNVTRAAWHVLEPQQEFMHACFLIVCWSAACDLLADENDAVQMISSQYHRGCVKMLPGHACSNLIEKTQYMA